MSVNSNTTVSTIEEYDRPPEARRRLAAAERRVIGPERLLRQAGAQ
jgi:hypothetical protein